MSMLDVCSIVFICWGIGSILLGYGIEWIINTIQKHKPVKTDKTHKTKHFVIVQSDKNHDNTLTK